MECNDDTESGGEMLNKFESNQSKALIILPSDIVIAVVGAAGTGKSTFICLLADQGYEPFIGESSEPHTREVTFVPATLPNGTRLYLIDTPGFSDTYLSDAEVLEMVSAKLVAAYESDIRLRGVIYIHPITNIGTMAPSMKNLSMFRMLCRSDEPSSVVLVTTHWSNTRQQTAFQIKWENQLKDEKKMWGGMIEKGSEIFRHDRGRESAAEIIQHLINKQVSVTLEIQSDIVDKHLQLKDTAVGKEIIGDLEKKQKEYDAELVKIQELPLVKQDQQAQGKLNERRAGLQEKMDQAEADWKKLEADGEALWKQQETAAGLKKVAEAKQRQAEERERQTNERERQAVEKERKLAEERERQAVEKERKLAEERERQAVEKERKLAEERQRQAVEKERKLAEERKIQAVEEERKLAENRERQAVEKERKLAEERERQAVEKERKLAEEGKRLAVEEEARQAEQRKRLAVEEERRQAEQGKRLAVEEERRQSEQRKRLAVEEERRQSEQRKRLAVEEERRQAEQRKIQAVEKERKLAEERERQAVEKGK